MHGGATRYDFSFNFWRSPPQVVSPFPSSIVRVRIEELTHSINTGQLGLDDPTIRRSPSPPPKYDSQGKRTNTREQRTKEKLTLERQSLIQIATKLNPAFKVQPIHCIVRNIAFNIRFFIFYFLRYSASFGLQTYQREEDAQDSRADR